MFDSAQRNIHYLRLSVTDLCNLRCRYCMPDGVEKLEREAVLTYEEFLRLAALFARCGVDTVRVTGGEPLVRKGVDQLVAGLKAIPGIRKVTMTTNGILLAQQLPALLAAGLDSVNISLDTLRPEVFQSITARDEFGHVMEGIHAALDSGIPVKLNCVPQVGVNEGELEDLAALAESRPLQVRFIEMMPIGYGAAMPCISGPELRERFARHRCRAWFSENFYCQYATYREAERLHLILYDNAASVQAKLTLAEELGLAGVLVCWEEVMGFQPPVW